MNWKKNLLHIMVTGVILVGGISITATSQASIDQTGKLLKMNTPTYRKSGYAYQVGITSSTTKELDMWKIYEYNINEETIKNQNNAIYCLKMGVGFGSSSGSPTAPRTYQKYADMKNPKDEADKAILEAYKEKLPDSKTENYNSIIWILDHCYVPETSASPTQEAIQEAREYKKQLLQNAEVPQDSHLYDDNDIMNDLIDIVQQLSIWYFTNGSDYQATNFNVKLANNTAPSVYKSLSDINSDYFEISEDLLTLYNYFVNNAKANKNTEPSTDDVTNPIKLISDTATVTLHKDSDGSQYYLAGPYQINKQTSKEFTISDMTVNNSNSYTLLNSSKQENGSTIKDFATSGEQFYLKIPKQADTNIENVELKINTKIKQNTITYWEVNGSSSANEQPVVEIKPQEKTFEAKVSLKVLNFDLALRKFITEVNGNPVNNPTRVPDVQKETLAGSTTTATKTHTKTPVEVKPGDKVKYTIRIYNEGEVSGYATKVVDYLPNGLKLDPDSTINRDNNWEQNGNTITSTKLQNDLIEPYVSGQDIKYKDIEVECIVEAQNSESEQRFKNVAEITEAQNQNHEEIVDRDSIPNNLKEEEKNNYNPGESTKGWGYEDDDDYEELVIPGKTFDLALRKFIEKVNNIDVPQTREPDVKEETLTGSTTTARKEHIKTPVQVKPGDTVLYKIRVYNEGDLSGYATKVVDYLPEGLELTEGSDINTTNGWTQEGNKITSTKLQNELIEGYVSGQEIKYKDLQVECTVTAKYSTSEQTLKNVAEIVEATCKDNPEITDRDSTPNNLKEEEKNNYNPEHSTEGWGYEDDDDYEELVIPARSFDLALRKFITQIGERELNREPNIILDPLIKNTDTTAIYNHRKDPVGVSVGDIVIYTIRIYNEGQLDGYVSEVTDYLPPQLEFVTDDEEHFNAKYGWTIDKSLRKATTKLFARIQDDNNIYTDENEENMLKAFDGQHLDSKELKIKCRVVETATRSSIITNIAEITEFTDAQGNVVTDRDSQKQNANIPEDEDLMDYKGNESNKSILTDETYFYKGQEDDDDFEKLILEEFDLALRKFITKVNDTPITSREPKFTNVKDDNGNYIYEHSKEPIEVETTDVVEYTIRIFNEGDIAGYAKEITDNIPQGLEFLPNNETNKEYGWVMLDENGDPTENVEEAVKITTNYLSKEQEQEAGDNLIEAFDSTKTSPDYKDVKVAFKVVSSHTYTGIITNIAEISDDSDETGNEVEDRDSTPDNNNEKEDDIDEEHVKLAYFDLALRKFITAVDDKEITSRVPQFKVTEDGKYTYEHSKEPVEVENGNIVTYTLRVYNEGTKDGYAKEIKDDLPEGLEFLPENEINKEYGWVMVDENGEPTENIEDAVAITTNYLSKEQGDLNERDNLLKKFAPTTMEEPDYRDVKIAFKVTEPNTSDRILINQAQISDDSDKDGKDVIDEDSTPDKWIEDEDDQDIEKVKVKYFDLSLRKWVTETIVIDEGKETVTPTGHKAEDDPEELVKVEIKESRLNKVVVKFRYKIRVKNEGEIAGYATEISDYIPEGLKFVQEDNPDWKEVDGKIVTLKDTLLQPGETAEVEVLLTWINGKNNFGEKINVAEISKDKNDSDTPDIDSTPDNKEPDEDDIDDAPVILSVKTGIGANMQYITIATISLGILATGVILIKKYIL